MPEGDTVHQTARRLHAALAGRTLVASDFRVPAYATVDLAGERVDEVVSRGKHLLIRVGEVTIHSHLKMEGSWEVYSPGQRWRHPAFQARAVLRTEETSAVGFQLGLLEVLPRDREEEAVGYLGPDLLGEHWDADEAVRRLAAHPDAPVAVALLDQRNLAGIGNVYANELCFLRGMLPTRPVSQADLAATVSLAHRLLTANRDRVVRVTTGDTRRGRSTWVYGRRGEPCRRCGTPIHRSELGRVEGEERVTYYCPNCQT
ncbi:DNA-formamidopyrimidine glycosylase family protein [Leifsonia sp. NPDC058230]|uniref:DNA-formamidopyrimidine glycosylase family protein n=1 Tax=Leifsonia sp. NPDC058230 TaxID=3346391 RepID=UPI0036DD3DA9